MGFRHLTGSLETKALEVVPPHQFKNDSLVFLDLRTKLPPSPDRGICLWAKGSNWREFRREGLLFLEYDHLKPAMAQVLSVFDRKSMAFPEGLSPRAHIDPTAKIGRLVRVGAGAVIQAGAVLEEEVHIGAGAVIEAEAIVGRGSIVHAKSVIGWNCRLGERCMIHSGAVIGSDGFGFAQGPDGTSYKIPQVGNVVLGHGVEVGALTTIDRATLGSTVIGDGCKFDNHCHVAHNCTIGPHSVFAAGFKISGSSRVGSHCLFAGEVVVTDHVHITDRVTIGGRSAITNDVTKPGAYTGYPLQPLRDGLKTIANLRELTRLRKDVATLSKLFKLGNRLHKGSEQ
ncbi:MAG: UDP-3-O-(3-hydroxymyristoyl)glucosamine N-acyltransferase [Bdellovibrio sp.]|nr:MAG: UDP-3-O-(3-hydroxymyristoyl)glucosamine N-acyltransferase [Bdellovibrio sp.]